MIKESSHTKKRFVVAAALLFASVLFTTLFSQYGHAFFPAYRVFSKTLISVQAAIMSIVPFSVWDVLIVAFAVVIVVVLVRYIRAKKPIVAVLSVLVLSASFVYVLFVGGWALNHYAPPLAEELNLEVHTYTVDELAQTTSYYLERAAEVAQEVPRNKDSLLVRQDFFELAAIAGASYENLEQYYSIFKGSSVPVKALLVYGEPLLYSGHVGIFFSPTGEATVPLNCAPADIPFTMCHEAAHRLAIASEEEANFAAFLACTHNSDVRFVYAGYYNAFIYCYNALYKVAPERASALLDVTRGLGVELVLLDRAATREHYRAYEGKFQQVGTAVNDTYLRSFGEKTGVQSYGLVVDYLIAWYQNL